MNKVLEWIKKLSTWTFKNNIPTDQQTQWKTLKETENAKNLFFI